MHLNDIAPRRYGAGFFGGYRPPFPLRFPWGRNLPLQKATRPVGENQIALDESRLPCGYRNVGAAPLDESIPLTGRQAKLE